MMAETAIDIAERERLERMGALVPRRSLARRVLRDRTAFAGLLILTIAFASAIVGPYVAPHDPTAQDVMNRYAGPSLEHPLGTDNLGRDEFSRLLHGARVSLMSAVAVSMAILVIGVIVGTISGLSGGLVDGLLMRVIDVLLAFPSLLLALAITGMLGPGLFHLLAAMAAVWWVEYARLIRGLVLSVKERPFVEAARALGLPAWRVASRHVIPNMISPVIVLGTLQTGRLLLALSALSFLGLGVQPPTPEWGAMLNEGKDYLASAPHLMIVPGLAITITALGFNLLGDGLRDALDPTT